MLNVFSWELCESRYHTMVLPWSAKLIVQHNFWSQCVIIYLLSPRPDICVPCNEMLLDHLPGGIGIIASLTLMSYVQMYCRLVWVEIWLCAADVVAFGARVAPLRDVLVFAVHVCLQVAFCCTPVLAVFTLELAWYRSRLAKNSAYLEPTVFVVDLLVRISAALVRTFEITLVTVVHAVAVFHLESKEWENPIQTRYL